MCGRIVLASGYREKIKALFADVEANQWLPPRYNIAPTQMVAAVRDSLPSQIDWLRWGFPSLRTNQPPLINARSETAHELPSFRDFFRSHRCLVFADGFYEWKRDPSRPTPQPYFFSLKNQPAFAIAALWQKGDPDCCVLLTTEANTLMHPIHDRMPVIFTPQAGRLWLNPETSESTLRALLQPYPSAAMQSHPVSTRVNRTSYDGEDLINPVQIFEQGTLI